MADIAAIARRLSDGAGWIAAQAADLRRRAEAALGRDHLRIGVTGLTGAGKTVFTTALVHALRHGGAHPAALPLFAGALGGGWRAEIEALPGLPAFPYAANLAGLVASPPQWPAPTRALFGLRLVLETTAQTPRKITIDVVDYPGEWLLDLDMLGTGYDDWSAAALARLQGQGAAVDAWIAETRAAAQDPAAAGRVAAAYGALLARLGEAGLRFLQPGRLLVPPLDGDGPPPPVPLPADMAGGSLHRAMAARHGAYLDQVVVPFHRGQIAGLDRQIVLFDVIGALARGPAAFADAGAALVAALGAFRYRRIPGLDLLRTRIDRVLVAATKIDHVATSQYLNARALVAECFAGTVWARAIAGDRLRFDVLAAIRATEDGWIRRDGAQRAALRGVLRAPGGTLRLLVPSDVPPRAPAAGDWPEGGFVYADFAPPDLSGHRERPFPGINLDKALDHLVGDRLR
jgi:predicted YcjX-like family ATPase